MKAPTVVVGRCPGQDGWTAAMRDGSLSQTAKRLDPPSVCPSRVRSRRRRSETRADFETSADFAVPTGRRHKVRKNLVRRRGGKATRLAQRPSFIRDDHRAARIEMAETVVGIWPACAINCDAFRARPANFQLTRLRTTMHAPPARRMLAQSVSASARVSAPARI